MYKRQQIGCLPYFFYTWYGLSANLKCRSKMYCMRLDENTGCKNRHLGTIAQICWAASLQLRQSENNLLNSNTSSTCPHNMVNFSPLTAEIGWEFGKSFKFQRVLHLGSVTVWHSSTGHQPNFAALKRECHLYSAGWPSRWALAHILV